MMEQEQQQEPAAPEYEDDISSEESPDDESMDDTGEEESSEEEGEEERLIEGTQLPNRGLYDNLLLAIHDGDIERVKSLVIDQHAPINPPTLEYADCPVLAAAAGHHAEILQFLIDRGASIDCRRSRRDGATPLHDAAHFSSLPCLRILLRHGADVHARDKFQRTPLHMAVRSNQLTALLLLIEAGADVNAIDREGNSCFDIADEHGYSRIQVALFEHGAIPRTHTKMQTARWIRPYCRGVENIHQYALLGHVELSETGSEDVPLAGLYERSSHVAMTWGVGPHGAPLLFLFGGGLEPDVLECTEMHITEEKIGSICTAFQHTAEDNSGPREWSRQRVSPRLRLHADNLRAEYAPTTPSYAAAVQSDRPFALYGNRPIGYYEVTIANGGEDNNIGIGIAHSRFSLKNHPGWCSRSFGYHGDVGRRYSVEHCEYGENYGEVFTTGDTIGCGVVGATSELFYTKNGDWLGVAFVLPIELQTLYPTVGLHSPNTAVVANFGQRPFKWSPSAVESTRWQAFSVGNPQGTIESTSGYDVFVDIVSSELVCGVPLDDRWLALLGNVGVVLLEKCQHEEGKVGFRWHSFSQWPVPVLRAAVSVVGHRAFLFGGKSIEGVVRNALFVADCTPWVGLADTSNMPALVWKEVPTFGDIPSPRQQAAMCYIPGKNWLALFGGKRDETFMNDLYFLQLDTMTWSRPRIAPDCRPPPPRILHTMTAIGSKLYVFGGWSGGRQRGDLEVFDVNEMRWFRMHLIGTSPRIRNCHAAVADDRGRLWITGGYDGHRLLNDVDILDTTYVPSMRTIGLKYTAVRDLVPSDFTLNIGPKTELHAHRIVLYCRSSYFREAFERTPELQSLTLNAVSRPIVLSLLEFMYSDAVGEENALQGWQGVRELLAAADMYCPEHRQRIAELCIASRTTQPSTYYQDMRRALYNPLFSDLWLVPVNEHHQADKPIPVHRAVMLAHCGYLRALLSSGMKESSHKEVSLVGVDPAVASAIVEWIYTGDISSFNGDNALSILDASNRYAVEGLKEFCEEAIIGSVDEENAEFLISIAEQQACVRLKQRCEEVLAGPIRSKPE